MTTIQKVEALNKVCENSLGFQCYSMGWEARSFREKTPLGYSTKRKFIGGKTFEEVVDNAYKFVFNKQ